MMGQVLLGLAVAWFTYSAVCLITNLQQARKLGIPLIIVPMSSMNVLWIVMEPLVFRLLGSLAIDLGAFDRYSRRGWHFHDKARTHEELGDVFALVTPRETFVHLAEPNAILDVFARRIDFPRPVHLYRKPPDWVIV